jgi:hypothetical protein
LPDTIEEQTRAVMQNLRLVLAGLDLGFRARCDGADLSDAPALS